VITGHEDPTKPDPSLDWQEIAQTHGTKVILMGAERIAAITQALINGGLPASTPAAMIEWGTTPRQRTVVATLDSLAEHTQAAGLGAPAIAVIGDVVRLREQIAWFEKRPLFGQRIVVTRTRAQSGELSARFTDLGAEVLSLPTLRIAPPTHKEPLLEALTSLGEYDWIVFSSANGVTAFFDGLLAAYDDIRALGNARLAAVGPATAAQLRQRHLRVDAQPAEFLGRHIAEAIAAQESLENTRLLVARAETANPDLVRELEDRGAIVDDVGFYRTEPEPLSPDGPLKTLRDLGADWIVFTSSSTASNLHAACPLPELRQQHPRLRFASIGPETSRTLLALGIKPDVQARQSTLDDLVQAVTAASPLKPA
jgi:uroporphyrinogen III methyltransferase/synthase